MSATAGATRSVWRPLSGPTGEPRHHRDPHVALRPARPRATRRCPGQPHPEFPPSRSRRPPDRGGHLPLLNPLADSGAPLLGGLNAGAFYPSPPVRRAAPRGLDAQPHRSTPRPRSGFSRCARTGFAARLSPPRLRLPRGHDGPVRPPRGGPGLEPALGGARHGRHDGGCGAREGDFRGGRIRILAPGIIGLGALWGLTALTGEPRAIAEMQLILLIVPGVPPLVRSSFRPSSWLNRFVYVGKRRRWALCWGAVIRDSRSYCPDGTSSTSHSARGSPTRGQGASSGCDGRA